MTKGERIKELRIKANLTQEALAKYLNTTKQNIYKYENNIITNIPSNNIEDMARILKTTPEYIMGWDVKINQNHNKGTISNNLSADSGNNTDSNNNTYTTNNYYSSPCEKHAVNHEIEATINSKEYFFRVLNHLKDMTDEQLLDMIKYAEFISNK